MARIIWPHITWHSDEKPPRQVVEFAKKICDAIEIGMAKYVNGEDLSEFQIDALLHSIKKGHYNRFIFDPYMRGKAIPREMFLKRNKRSSRSNIHIISDQKGYVSPIDDTWVEGRTAHREHQRQHDVIECGDANKEDFMKVRDYKENMPDMGESIKRAMEELGD